MNDLNILAYRLLNENNASAKKSFGQNFLTDSSILDQIIESIDFSQVSQIVEIGPGLGFLTEKLLTKNKKLTVIEADRDMVNILQKRFPNLDIIFADCLKVDYTKFHVEQTLFVGNLPYNITKNIVELFASFKAPAQFSFMVQREVGEKLKYVSGGKHNCALGAYLGLKGKFFKEVKVPRTSFSPMPNVDSVFVNFKTMVDVDPKAYEFLKKLYLHSNKTLSNKYCG